MLSEDLNMKKLPMSAFSGVKTDWFRGYKK
jgi:hypothetical protein